MNKKNLNLKLNYLCTIFFVLFNGNKTVPRMANSFLNYLIQQIMFVNSSSLFYERFKLKYLKEALCYFFLSRYWKKNSQDWRVAVTEFARNQPTKLFWYITFLFSSTLKRRNLHLFDILNFYFLYFLVNFKRSMKKKMKMKIKQLPTIVKFV